MPEAEPLFIKTSSEDFKTTTVIIDAFGTICSYNHTLPEKMSRYECLTRENWLGSNYFNIMASFPGACPHSMNNIINHLKEVLNNHMTGYVCEVRILRDDSYIWLRLEASLYETSLQNDFRGLIVTHIDITHLKHLEDHLQDASSQIRTLRGMLPICAVCKRIRDEEDEWNTVESFVEKHTHAEFTHDICPECIRKLYPQYARILDPHL
ncbi:MULTISPECIES: hypothetical protein [unclassified Paenibacillus]|uniref:PAC domain-containing protein n=1 Tax=Paenibacillus provencensis TaxID=441151 RepID=A0ABW3PVE6_9BACL|nr:MULTISPECIES: hypothetical protein [unclassified Paenibacillus]MCM3127641.1 hypothetical protein [Paenibacillus sp. MER 78]SFS39783.1 hypothetical protein SAMN04488601_101326 [Paenibacillus sp. 453mf]